MAASGGGRAPAGCGGGRDGGGRRTRQKSSEGLCRQLPQPGSLPRLQLRTQAALSSATGPGLSADASKVPKQRSRGLACHKGH